MPAADQITDYTKFKTEFGNIPCKLREESEDISEETQSEEIKKPLTFSF